MSSDDQLADHGAEAIRGAFMHYHDRFKEITSRGKDRFEMRAWHAMQDDILERLDLYTTVITSTVFEIRGLLGEQVFSKPVWTEMKRIYSKQIAGRGDLELGETFFNSVTRRIFSTLGVDPAIEFVDSDFEEIPLGLSGPVYRIYPAQGPTQVLLQKILADYPFAVPFRHLERDTRLAAETIDAVVRQNSEDGQIYRVEMLIPVFYRLKGAYLIGRILVGSGYLPIVLCLRHPIGGLSIDAVLLTADEASILFSFTRSYFHVESENPHELVQFLKSIMPLKRIAEIYISLGYNKHGKTELYRDLLQHLSCSTDQFVSARGEKGMVMLVFTMQTYDLVFKVIRDRFAEPKTTTRQDVINHYQLVFHRDRAGRLVDAQEFEHLRFHRGCFTDDLLKELLEGAPSSVTLDGEWVDIKHLYTERRLTPLNIFIREASEKEALDAVIDYGNAIKNLAATNIFPGDILLKNFGVTRHGRVVFYDYDELSLLSDCHFRQIPQARDDMDDFQPEPWFFVGKNDIFPEEFRTFLGLNPPYRQVFFQHHEDLFGVEFWRKMQKRHEAGEIIDIFPYPQSKRLNQDEGSMD